MREEDYPLRNDAVWNYLHVLYRVHMLRESNERNVILDQENMFNPLFIAVAVNKSNNFIEQFPGRKEIRPTYSLCGAPAARAWPRCVWPPGITQWWNTCLSDLAWGRMAGRMGKPSRPRDGCSAADAELSEYLRATSTIIRQLIS